MDYEKGPLEKIVQGAQSLGTRLGNIFRTGLGPVSWIWRRLASLGRFYKAKIWRHARNKEGRLTWLRTGSVVLATLFFIWLIPTALYASWQGLLMATTMKTEQIYLTDANEVDPDGNVHAIRGCTVIPCGESNTVYFRVRPTLAHNIYSLIDHGGVFYPDYTASVVAPGINSCTVTSYGIRVKALMRGWDVYPDMLDATCTPYETNTPFE